MREQNKKNNVAILLLTCDSYAKIAVLTLRLLRHLWVSPPEIFVCGVSRKMSGETVIPFSVDSKDWVGIAYQAVSQMLSEGYDYCYLVLDDHPPVSTCNSEYLVDELPALADKLNATVVSMVGWDQIRVFQGTKLGAENHFWLRNDTGYRWLFNLHPGCWSLPALRDILEIIMKVEPLDRSARTFEGRACSKDTPIPEQYRQGSYRVCGNRFAKSEKWFAKSIVRQGVLQLLHTTRFVARCVGRDNLLRRVDQKAKLYTDYLNGPYPMFWSGLMQRGKVHNNAVKFLRFAGLDEYADAASKL